MSNLDDALSRVNAYLDARAQSAAPRGNLDPEEIISFNRHPLYVGDLKMLIAHAASYAAAARHPGG